MAWPSVQLLPAGSNARRALAGPCRSVACWLHRQLLGLGLTLSLMRRSSQGTVYMPKILPKFSDSPSHRIFEHMHEALNIDKK
jgi:hypothetical protein